MSRDRRSVIVPLWLWRLVVLANVLSMIRVGLELL